MFLTTQQNLSARNCFEPVRVWLWLTVSPSCTDVLVFTVPRAQARSLTPASLTSCPLPSRLYIPCTTMARWPTARRPWDALTLTSQAESFWILASTRREMICMKRRPGHPSSFFLETWAVFFRLTSFLTSFNCWRVVSSSVAGGWYLLIWVIYVCAQRVLQILVFNKGKGHAPLPNFSGRTVSPGQGSRFAQALICYSFRDLV